MESCKGAEILVRFLGLLIHVCVTHSASIYAAPKHDPNFGIFWYGFDVFMLWLGWIRAVLSVVLHFSEATTRWMRVVKLPHHIMHNEAFMNLASLCTGWPPRR